MEARLVKRKRVYQVLLKCMQQCATAERVQSNPWEENRLLHLLYVDKACSKLQHYHGQEKETKPSCNTRSFAVTFCSAGTLPSLGDISLHHFPSLLRPLASLPFSVLPNWLQQNHSSLFRLSRLQGLLTSEHLPSR